MEASEAAVAFVPAVFGATCFFFILYIVFFVFVFAISIGSIVVWVWMIVDVAKRPDEQFPNPGPNTKLMWLLVIVLGGAIGGIVYYVVVYRTLGPAGAAAAPLAPAPTAVAAPVVESAPAEVETGEPEEAETSEPPLRGTASEGRRDRQPPGSIPTSS